jgi:DNA-directed RNA polymerase specialized sigma24 family protein
MPEEKRFTGPASYASSGDFCRIFCEETDSLYRLSFLLTADRDKAQQCFVSGLEDSLKGSRVFKEWARSWARRALIQNAVRVINPRPMGENIPSSFNRSGKPPVAEPVEIAAILDLAPFERFVYVMSVLERYSDQDCSVLLGCSRREVNAARIRAFEQIGTVLELHIKQQVDVGSWKPVLDDNCRAVLELQLATRLATLA